MKKENGFTLIELLAVIIILGILMIIAIPSVTKYISDSRKSTYIDTAKQVASATKNLVNSGKLEMYDTSVAYYIPNTCIKVENGEKAKSPYGEFIDDRTYVVVTYDGQGYDYYWVSLDDTGTGVKEPISIDKLEENDIETDLTRDDVKDNNGVGKNSVVIFNSTCDGKINKNAFSDAICKRVKNIGDLHTEICNNTNTSFNCQSDGYSLDESIVYGNIWDGTSELKAGDAFDCKVTKNGDYTERFYYVSDYFDTNSQSFDNEYGVLIYSSNLINGALGSSGAVYYSQRKNYFGPSALLRHLPSVETWDNIKLKNKTRAILGYSYNNLNTILSTTGNGTYELPTNFDYIANDVDRAARLITVMELKRGCYNGSTLITRYGSLSEKCKFLFEKTRYSNDSIGISGIWIETPISNVYESSWQVNGGYRSIDSSYTNINYYAVRPVIEIPKSKLE